MTAGALRGTIAPLRLLEREAELAALEAMLAAARLGDGRLVIVEGGAGIGKTRLLAEARALAAAADFEVLTARGGELEGEFAFGIVRQLFEARLAGAAGDERNELLSGAAGLSASMFTSAPTSSSGDGAESSFAMLHSLYWLAANFASRKPTLLVVDDLHWADEPSLRWLAYLARRIEGLPLLLLAGTRPPEQANSPTLVTQLFSDPAAVAIRPGNLGPQSAAMLARESLGAEPHPVFAAALQTGSGGNPLFLVALLDALRQEGISPTPEHAAYVIELGPQAIARGIATRLARLPSEAARLLRAAATLGDRTELPLAAELADLEPKAALSAASALVTADLLRHENPLEFIHPVVRTAVLEGMSAADRVRAHRRAAEALLEAGALPEQSAAHLLQTIPDHDSFVVATLRLAAKRSLAHGAPQAAVAYLRRALTEPPSPVEEVDVLGELGAAELNIDASEAAEHLRRAIDAIADVTQRPDITLSYVRALVLVGRHQDAGALLRMARDRFRGFDQDLHWRLEGRLLIWSEFDPELYAAETQRFTAIDERDLTGGTGAGVLLAALAMVEAQRGVSRARAVDFAERALASGAFEEAGERLNGITPLLALTIAGEIEAASAAFEASFSSARRSGDYLTPAGLHLYRGLLRIECGELLAAEEDLQPFAGNAFHDSADFQAFRAAFLAEILLERGEIDQAEALVVPPTAMREGYGVYLLVARGRVHLGARRPEQALADFLEAGRVATAAGTENPGVVPWRSLAALSLNHLGREPEALELAREELDLSRRWGAPRTVGISLRALGLVEGGEAGERLLQEAVEVLAGSPARLEHARALVDLGAVLRRSNSRSEARQLLRDGVELAQRCGATALVERANDELAATGAHRRTVLLSGLAELTASERRVAQLAAEDLSNKEVAQALFVTVKTVEQHLGRVYRKLDISSRRQLGAALGGPAEVTPTA